MPRPASALQLLPSVETDTLDDHTPAREHRHLAHLSTERIEHAIRQAGGNLTVAAEKLGVGRSTLYTRTTEEPSLLATRDEILESFVDEAETAIVAAVRRGDVNAATFVLRTQGHKRGWSTWAARHEAEQRSEPPRPKVDMTAALKALTPQELQQLEALVSKLEANAKSGAGLDADDEGSRRSFRRRHFRGEVAASDEVDEVEAVAGSGEVEPTAPGDVT